jgi:molybdopterin-synthase adenylyltransferase
MKERNSRQSFLGKDSEYIFENIKVAIVGLGGGGSHIVQQLAHLGIKNFILFDGDHFEESNINRLVGSRDEDTGPETPKTEIARRLITGISPDANITLMPHDWHEGHMQLRECDFMFTSVDSFGTRNQLEKFSRRFLVPMIDVGMDVYESGSGYFISGQVVRSIPNEPCMWCLNILNNQNVNTEAQGYGAAGGKPQVVWSNGILASAAVGLFVEMITAWNGITHGTVCLEYDGNKNTLTRSNLMNLPQVKNRACDHYLISDVGDALFLG